jgi:NAD dependent epimerase/dehydratase family enzyme
MAIVLGDGSALTPLVMLTRFGLGGPQYGGKTKGARQRFSWVHIEDVYRAIDFLIGHENLVDAINVSSPNPVDNRELMATLRRVLGVRFSLPLFSWMLELGAFAMRTETELLLKSRWVVPKRLLDAGFEFEFPRLEDALRDILGRENPLERSGG